MISSGGLLKALHLPCLTAEEERDLARRSAAGDDAAAERLIQTHLKMVFKVARAYGRFGLPVNDLIQEGTIGLIQAVRKFNPDRDARLSTYAAWWIRAAIQDYVVRSWSLVRVGKTAAHRALFFAIKRMAADLKTGADALSDEVLTRLAARFDLPKAEVSGFAGRICGLDQSLDVPVSDEADADTLLERLPGDQASPEEIVAEGSSCKLLQSLVDRALTMLPAREATIIRRRHLSDAVPTFEAIGRELGISKDRVRQLEKRALERLRDVLSPLVATHGLPGAST
ncbi:MAG TPA: RNA polymerase factor sigma-32 [Arenibaculum sp.]|nr:RNA polymerase factor sigma-32 [Arenibaculum sp.]